MKRIPVLICLSALIFLFTSQPAFAATAVQPSDEEMLIGARMIVSGDVVDISTAVQNGMVYSYIRLRVEEVFKGQVSTREVVLKQPGGESGDLGTLIYGMPRFEVGKRVLVYLDTWADGALRVHQWFLGKYDIAPDAMSGREIVSRGEGERVSVIRQAGTVVTLADSFDSYKAMMKRLLKANRERARAFELSAYGDAPILSEPVEYAALRAGGEVVTQWATSNPPQPPRWFEADSNQAITFYVNPAGAPANTVLDDVTQALAAWSQLAGSSLRLSVGETSGCGIQNADGQNTISFTNCDNYFSPSPGCAGILGVGGIVRYIPSQTMSLGGMMFYKAVEANVSINPYALCNLKNRCDLIETLTHEIGHALGLGHSSDPKATMYDFAQFDNRCAGVFSDDLDGIRFLYPAANAGGGVQIRTATNLPQAQAGQAYSARFEAAGGSGSYTWRLVGGELPDGITLNANGTLSGATQEVCAFNFIAQARDATGKTSQAPFALAVQAPSAAPVILSAEFKKKKVTIYGANFTPSGAVYIDDALVFTTVEPTKITTVKRKLKPGTHTIVVRDSQGRESNRFTFSL